MPNGRCTPWTGACCLHSTSPLEHAGSTLIVWRTGRCSRPSTATCRRYPTFGSNSALTLGRYLGRRGCWVTAFNFAKLLLSLDPLVGLLMQLFKAVADQAGRPTWRASLGGLLGRQVGQFCMAAEHARREELGERSSRWWIPWSGVRQGFGHQSARGCRKEQGGHPQLAGL